MCIRDRLYNEFKVGLDMLPVIPKRYCEYPIICDYQGWKFRATLDAYYEPRNTNIENKTGMTLWTQERADYSKQITCQNWINYILDGDVFDDNLLQWLDFRAWTATTGKEQQVQVFHTKRTIEQVLEFQKIVDEVIKLSLIHISEPTRPY